MAIMNISLPESLRHFIEEEVLEGGYSSTSDYMRDLVRQRQRSKAVALDLDILERAKQGQNLGSYQCWFSVGNGPKTTFLVKSELHKHPIVVDVVHDIR